MSITTMIVELLSRYFQPPLPPPLELSWMAKITPGAAQTINEALVTYGKLCYFSGVRDASVVAGVLGFVGGMVVWERVRRGLVRDA